jgi:hypothetical protein
MTTTPRRRTSESRFVEDGHLRARSAIEPAIRAQVVAEYADRFEAAGLWRKFLLRRAIEREINLRVRNVAPPDALY